MNKRTFVKFGLMIWVSLILCSTQFVLAATVTPPPIIPPQSQDVKLPHQTSSATPGVYLQEGLLPGIATTIITITAALSLLVVIISGIMLITSYVNPENAKKATQTLTWAIVGLIISGLSYAIVKILASLSTSF